MCPREPWSPKQNLPYILCLEDPDCLDPIVQSLAQYRDLWSVIVLQLIHVHVLIATCYFSHEMFPIICIFQWRPGKGLRMDRTLLATDCISCQNAKRVCILYYPGTLMYVYTCTWKICACTCTQHTSNKESRLEEQTV